MSKIIKKRRVDKKSAIESHKKKESRHLPIADLHMKAGLNNSIFNLTDKEGNTVALVTCGSVGFKGCKKSTTHATEIAFHEMMKKVMSFGVKELTVKTKGKGPKDVLVYLGQYEVKVSKFIEESNHPYGGCRLRRRRRV